MKVLLSLLVFISWYSFALAQVEAGESTAVCPGQNIQLSGQADGACCYEWSPKEGLSDPYILSPTTSPLFQSTTYTLKAWKKDGVQLGEDEVMITVADNVSLNIENKKCCYKRGDHISLNDFEIETFHQGFQFDGFPGEIRITSDLEVNGNVAFQLGSQPVDFAAVCIYPEGEVVVGTASTLIDEVNPSFGQQQKITISTERLERLLNQFSIGRLECKVKLVPEGEIKWGTFRNCCPEKETNCILRGKYLDILNVSFGGGLECKFPFPPAPALLNIKLKLGAKLTIPSIKAQSTCAEGKTKFCVPGSVSVTGSLGLETIDLEVIEVEVLKVEAAGFIKTKPAKIKVCSDSFKIKFDSDGLCVDVGASFSVKLASLINYKQEWVLATACL